MINNYYILKKAIVLILFGHLFLGIGHIAFLPPWEGFDETAHYSSIQQIADTGIIPRYGSARISADVEKYAIFAPMPYSGSSPVENNGGFTYKSFFDSPDETIAKGADHIQKRPLEPRRFINGENINWQSQHPPFFYIILVPIFILTKHMSWLNQLLILRAVSYLIAWMALVIAAYTCLRIINSKEHVENHSIFSWMLIGIALWPVIFPSWFTDMARLGNDSLCALVIAFIWLVMIKFKDNQSGILIILIGFLLGIGCLIKAFFVPIVFGVGGYFFYTNWINHGRAGLVKNILGLFLMLFVILVISGWWYYLNWIDYGIILGSDEMIRLKKSGGMWANLFDKFTFFHWIRGHVAAITTFAWSGTWSFARPPYIFLTPLTLMVLFLGCVFIWKLTSYDMKTIEWLPIWLTLPVILGLSYHILIRIALIGEGRGTGGYYLHFLFVPLVMALGFVLKKIWATKVLKLISLILFGYTVTFSLTIFLMQAMLYSGKLHIAGDSKFYKLSDSYISLFDFKETIARLDVLSSPILGLTLLIIGGALIIRGFGISRNILYED